MTDKNTTDAALVQRVIPKLRRALAGSAAGVARAELRRRLASRDKRVYDAALDLLIAVGDVVAEPSAVRSGTRYRLTDAARQPEHGRTSRLETSTNNTTEEVN